MKGLWLIGFRGAGKTTLGKILAARKGRPFFDLDEEWEKRNGEDIPSFVLRAGEEEFRRQECALLLEVSLQMNEGHGLVVATGGGFVDWPPSREILLASAHPKVFLNAPAEALWERLSTNTERLKIGHLSDISALGKLLEKRRPFYEKIATSVWINRDISESLALLENLLTER